MLGGRGALGVKPTRVLEELNQNVPANGTAPLSNWKVDGVTVMGSTGFEER